MRVSFKWLSEYVDLADVTPEELAERLTHAGVAVDAVTPRNQGVSGVVVGHVVSCEKHPNADRLHVCTVDVGGPELLTIVCGAANVRVGMKVPTALVGAQLPHGRIGRAKLRGVESHGMLCSAKEIGLEVRWLPKEQTEGLYVLPDDAPVGADIVSLLELDDVVLELDLTPNRADCLSLRGLAYEVGAILGRPVRLPHPQPARSQEPAPVRVRIDTPRCSLYEAQVLEGIQPQPSPLWMQMRLLASGVRPLNLIVDVTNYVMLEWGQPLHAFDLDDVRQGQIVVRQAQAGERIVTLDGAERVLTEDTIVISDPERAIGIAGVMGGENSEVRDSTRRIVLESAVFDPGSVRRTGQRLGLRSEAQQRFEKGVDPEAVRVALDRATQLLEELGGAKAVGPVVAVHQGTPEVSWTVRFSPDRCNRWLGTDIPAEEMRSILERLGFALAAVDGSQWQVVVPSRRQDVRIEADLFEEIGRLAGYDRIPSTLPRMVTTAARRTPAQQLRQQTREVLIGTGMTEVWTYTLTSPAQLEPLRLPEDSPYRQMIPLLRPMSEERTALRTHFLPSLAQVARHNLAHGVTGGAIFEIGRVYWPAGLPLTKQPCERHQWAGLWFGMVDPDVGQRPRPYDFYDVKGVVEAWLTAFGWLEQAVFERSEAPWLHPGRSADVRIGGERIGRFGELHPDTAAAWELGRALYAEFDLDALAEMGAAAWRVRALPRYPAVRRDLAAVVDHAVPAQALLDAAREAVDQPVLESCRVFDVYAGAGIPEGKKSVAVAFTWRAEDRTLTDEEVRRQEERIVAAWSRQFGAVLRDH
jgi:phenylalanyl-tRNA synthetase beta chain